MLNKIRSKTYSLLRLSERFTKTDMVYLAKGGFWLTLAQTVSSLSSLIIAIVFANLLSKETYGTYSYILSVAGILGVFGLPGLTTALTKAVSQGYEGSFVPGVIKAIKWGSLAGLAGLITAGYYFINGQLTLALSFAIMSAFLPFIDPLAMFGSYLQGKRMFKLMTQFNVSIKIIVAIVLITTVFLTKNILIIIAIYFSIHTLTYFFFLRQAVKRNPPNQQQDPGLVNYAKHLSVMNAISVISNYLDKILVFHFLGPVQLAIYQFATTPPQHYQRIFKTVGPLAFPKLSQRPVEELKKTLPLKLLKFFLVIAILIAIYIILAPWAFKILFPQYTASIIYSQVFVLGFLLYPKSLIGTTMTAHAKKKQLYILNIGTYGFKIVSLLILAPLYGIWGVIAASLGTEVVSLGILSYLFKRL